VGRQSRLAAVGNDLGQPKEVREMLHESAAESEKSDDLQKNALTAADGLFSAFLQLLTSTHHLQPYFHVR
jgi:hypothetical protein